MNSENSYRFYEISNVFGEKVEQILKDNNIFYENIGTTQKDYFEITGELKIDIKELYKINNQWYNNY